MIIAFKSGATQSEIYVRGSINDEYLVYTMTLVSKYNNMTFNNNQEINSLTKVVLAKVNITPNWSHFRFKYNNTPATDFWNKKDFGGYYEFILEGTNDLGNYVTLHSGLCRVVNNFTDNPDITYVSDNENNEQFTYYNE